MKFSLINLLYLLVRLAPIIVISFFSLQFIFNRDLISVIYLSGLVIACLLIISVGNIGYSILFKNRANNKGNKTALCKVFELTQNGPLSVIPLSQAVLGYSFFFLIYILNKNNVKPKLDKTYTGKNGSQYPHTGGSDEIFKQNIPILVILPMLIMGDLFWNINFGCDNFATLLISLTIGSLFGFFWALLLDSSNSRMKEDGVCGKDHFCKATQIDSVYSTYATGKEMDLSLFNVINNSICDDYKKLKTRSIYKCRLKPTSSNLATNTPIGNNISEEDELKRIISDYEKDTITSTNKIKTIWDSWKPT
jgi:hypothetical protein